MIALISPSLSNPSSSKFWAPNRLSSRQRGLSRACLAAFALAAILGFALKTIASESNATHLSVSPKTRTLIEEHQKATGEVIIVEFFNQSDGEPSSRLAQAHLERHFSREIEKRDRSVLMLIVLDQRSAPA